MINGAWRKLVIVGVLLSMVMILGLDVAARMPVANVATRSGTPAVTAYNGQEDDIEGEVTLGKCPELLCKPLGLLWKAAKCGGCYAIHGLFGWGPDCLSDAYCGGDWWK